MSILGNQVKKRTDISEEIIANNMIAASTAAAKAYLNATLAASTPEFRSMCEDSLQQILTGHAQLAKLVSDKGWEDPYVSPEQQLSGALDKSKLVIEDTQ